MKYTNKQQQEIDYLKTWSKVPVTDEDIKEFIDMTVFGKQNTVIFQSQGIGENPLIRAKQRLGVTTTMWKEDMVKGLLSIEELLDEASCEYERKLILSIRDSVTPKYRKEHIRDTHGHLMGTILSITSFPDLQVYNINYVRN